MSLSAPEREALYRKALTVPESLGVQTPYTPLSAVQVSIWHQGNLVVGDFRRGKLPAVADSDRAVQGSAELLCDAMCEMVAALPDDQIDQLIADGVLSEADRPEREA